MSQRIAYYRVSTKDQSIESQRTALGSIDVEFSDVGVSGSVLATDRKGFAEMLGYIRKGDTLCVYSIDRMGRDAIDIQRNVRSLLDKGVEIEVSGLGKIASGAGELIVAVLARIAAMERQRIAERTEAGRATARQLLASTGRTQHGKVSLGRPVAVDPTALRAWRKEHAASISETAKHFSVSTATVKRSCAIA